MNSSVFNFYNKTVLPGLVMLCLVMLNSANLYAQDAQPDAPPVKVSEVKVLGLSLLSANKKDVSKHLNDLGGFTQERSTQGHNNISRFFPISNQRDSYDFTFRFNTAGSITSVKRLYRPYSLQHSNQRTPLQTKDIALSFITQIGQPSFINRKGNGGPNTYLSYVWQDDQLKITVDREGSEKHGDVFVEYQVKGNDPFLLAKK
ncbi:hypothetical protein [Thiomicrorhabdus aquaedulcis]|uniref:hypothetical protein n=1 Tax=Thiomicrorhabdus aquaedulcis TaxID=2211106 RepID=UPI000FD9ABE5|nr:hypothetical protein [Thiomicrorhabdus aquaedulcis]